MFIIETLWLGLANIRLHKLRSLLTALGIIFGVFAVIMMTAIGEGNKQAALAKIRQLGASNIIIRSIKPPESSAASTQRQRVAIYGIKRIDLARMLESIKAIDFAAPLKEAGGQVTREALRAPATVFGTTPELLRITSLRVDRGRYLTEQDQTEVRSVAVIGAEVASRLFPLQDPLGEQILLDGTPFTVVGVLRPVGLAGGAGSALVGRDLNFDVHIPLAAARARWGDLIMKITSGSMEGRMVEITEIYLRVRNGADVLHVGEQVRAVLNMEHAAAQDVEVIVPMELLEQERSTRIMQDALLVAIACISLLVGGIGIMNIMLATVTERTREIGIRRAVGATRKHIMAQFLVETTVLSGLGGLIGVGLGIGGVQLLALFHNRIAGIAEPQVTLWSIVVSFFVATSVGIVFGLYPAFQAARQDPIVALRHD